MQGDFSQFKFDPALHTRGVAEPALGPLRNVTGVLQQQGRVITDADLSEGELLDLAWQDQAGRDIIGAGVCAVPAAEPDGFEIVSAEVDGTQVIVQVRPGRAWVDGILARLPGVLPDAALPVDRAAAYFGPPWSTPLPTTASIADGTRDAVVLEVSEESLHAFQYPQALLEPALGGVDTAERAYVNCRLRLLRLGDGEDCSTVATKLRDDPAAKGHLSVTLTPPISVAGDCPVVGGGGYTGFEHHLYRIEIAAQNAGAPPRFVWSAWNGGLVGRGRFDTSTNPDRVIIDAGRAAIVHSGLLDFYLEALQYDALRGGWKVVYGTIATLNADHDLELAAPASFGTLPATADPVFFRLWNGIADIAGFTDIVSPNELRDGICLAFDAPAANNYRAGDYWTFTVRAGDVANPLVLVDDAPPLGIIYHRVALAEIHWRARGNTAVSGTIEDCRKRFRPLTNQKICCTFLVGDGVTSFGDFNSLEQAAAHLPAAGGELCLLPGVHRANLVLRNRNQVRIHGCRWRSLILPRDATRAQPILHIVDCAGVEICDLDLVTFDATAVLIERGSKRNGRCRDISVHDCRVIARHNAIRANEAEELAIADNRLHLLDTRDGLATMSVLASDALIERNTLVLLPFVDDTPDDPDEPSDDPTLNPADPCARPEIIYRFPLLVLKYVTTVWAIAPAAVLPQQPYRALGGIHLRAGSLRVRVLENRIAGGGGNGIVLGGDVDPAPPIAVIDTRPAPAVVVAATAAGGVGIASEGEFIALLQDEREQPVSGVDVYLEDDSSTATDRSDDNGMTSVKTRAGRFRVAVPPGYQILRIVETQQEKRRLHTVTLGPSALIPANARWLHEITIAANDIAWMGLSGIGFGLRRGVPFTPQVPQIPPNDPRGALLAMLDAELANLALTPLLNATHPVRDLVISDNRLHDNLRNVFDKELLDQAQLIGRGGISLALAESAVIRGNQIYANGVSALDPVCGIYVGWGNDLEIVDNSISDNGVVDARYERDRKSGLRGGIYVAFAAVQSATLSGSSGRKPALRAHDNRVDQPAGRALTAYAFGPVSVANNHFNSEYSGLYRIADAFVGGVLLFNFGGMHRLLLRLSGDLVDAPAAGQAGGGTFRASKRHFRALAEAGLPGGETLFNDNYIRVGVNNRGIVAQAIASLDDLGYATNTSAVYRGDRFFGNALLLGDSVRATASRLREDATRALSLLSWGIRMNMTALNQGDHCIVALPKPDGSPRATVDTPNQVLDYEICRRLSEPEAIWEFLVWVLSAQADLLGGELSADAFTTTERAQMPAQYAGQALKQIQYNKTTLMQRHQQEAITLSAEYGAAYPAAVALKAQADADAVNVHLVAQAAETFGVVTPRADEGGSTLSGRVGNDRGQGLSRLRVELTRRNGDALEAVALTDASGYFSASFDARDTGRLAREGDLFLRVTSARGSEVLRDTTPLRFAAGAQLRAALVVPLRLVPRAIVVGPPAGGTGNTGATGSTGATGATGSTGTTGGAVPPNRRTPLERLEMDDAVLARLRAAGIPDVETLAETKPAALLRIVDDEATVKLLLARARRLLGAGATGATGPTGTASPFAPEAAAATTVMPDAGAHEAEAQTAEPTASSHAIDLTATETTNATDATVTPRKAKATPAPASAKPTGSTPPTRKRGGAPTDNRSKKAPDPRKPKKGR